MIKNIIQYTISILCLFIVGLLFVGAFYTPFDDELQAYRKTQHERFARGK